MARQVEPSRHTAYYNVLDACKKGGCPICTLALDLVEHYIDSVIYENVNDPGNRDAIVRARGYCNDHSWKMREMRAGFGAAIMYRDVLRHVGEDVADGHAPDIFGAGHSGGGLLDRLSSFAGAEQDAHEQSVSDPHLACPACQERERYELIYLGALIEHLGEDEMTQAFQHTGGLCLVHLDQAGAATRDGAALKRLLDLQRAAMKALDDELSEFIRKHDYRFRSEGMGAEGDSWVRAIAMVAGKPGIR